MTTDVIHLRTTDAKLDDGNGGFLLLGERARAFCVAPFLSALFRKLGESGRDAHTCPLALS